MNFILFEQPLPKRVTIDKVSSDVVAMTSGVPQGTVLDPIILIIYMNKIVENIQYSTIYLFADDIMLYTEIRDAGIMLE